MSLDRTEQLIDRLTSDLKPTRVVTLKQLMLIWLIVSVLIGAYYLHSVGVRPDLANKFSQGDYVFGFLLYVEAFLFASWLTMRMVIPGRQPRKLLWHALILGFSAAAAVAFYAGIEQWAWASLSEFDGIAALGCCLRISVGALLPAAILLSMSQLMAPMQVKTMTAYLWFAAATLISIVSQLNCPIDGLSHVVIGHGVLLIVTGIIGWLIFWMISKLAQSVRQRARIRSFIQRP